ncbi:hypothetical protein [Streptomyces viridochromogenes]|uniref:Uncharacterized protein n=1 Tax=Streptomyces viridochromogenes Tue57 TaxID=1160705 RepID=L8PS56_STRVR|nr:hypothetical protein [Streptomyces viridochromogenes]ELS58914.1 hypothetical protein STVIR_0114 [Streptomyces viridochromogenes Tue57]
MQRALELSAPTSTMTRTLPHIDAAACAHHDGDSEQACRRTIAALTALPDAYRTGLVRRRTLALYEAIPAQHHRERAVRKPRDLLAPSRGPVSLAAGAMLPSVSCRYAGCAMLRRRRGRGA